MKQHFLQSLAWEKYEQSEGNKTFRIQGEGFSALAILKVRPVGSYLFCPYGPALSEVKSVDEFRSCFETALKSLSALANEHNAFFVRIEPTFPVCENPTYAPERSASAKHHPYFLTCREFKLLKLKKSHDIDPAHTWVLDLTQPESKIFADMEKEKGRLWRNCGKKGITLRQTQNPEEVTILTDMLKTIGNQNHFIPQEETHLKKQLEAGFATLYIAELDGQPIAASLVYDYDSVRYYAHAASDLNHRKLVAGSILLVQMIVDAKAKGLKTFDFWGITTSTDKSHPWYGFTQYKKSFGGKQVDYAGTWDLPLNPLRYNLYQVIRKINRIRRKIHH